ncbi:hypothetical protein Scep_004245 [Stephania cephalantha]|uniref:Uncharacterized protein n=1 Tax=Stephania cephalantha TaxID=152367 RepID=A0AAP0KS36_9MAGN
MADAPPPTSSVKSKEEIRRFENAFWSVGRPDRLGISVWIEIRNRVRERGQHWEIYFENFGATFPLAFL